MIYQGNEKMDYIVIRSINSICIYFSYTKLYEICIRQVDYQGNEKMDYKRIRTAYTVTNVLLCRRRQMHKQVTRRHLDMITHFPLLTRTVAEYVLLLWTMLTALSKLRKQQNIVAHQLQSISFQIFRIM